MPLHHHPASSIPTHPTRPYPTYPHHYPHAYPPPYPGYLLLHALDLGMEDRLKDMKRVVKQKYHIKSMLDFAEARKAPPQSVIKPFFSRLLADERVRQDYDESCEQLYVKLVERAEVKKQARATAAPRPCLLPSGDQVSEASPRVRSVSARRSWSGSRRRGRWS